MYFLLVEQGECDSLGSLAEEGHSRLTWEAVALH